MTRLAVHTLEDRAVPAATPFYSDVTQNLNITAENGDELEVRILPGADKLVGYVLITATNGGVESTVWDSLLQEKPVNSLLVNFSTVATGSLLIGPAIHLGGGVTVLGARTTSAFTLRGQVGGGVSYRDTAGANDTIVVDGNAAVGGGLSLNLSEGTNLVQLQTATVGGNLTVTGRDGADTLELLEDGNVIVGGSVKVHLGNGANVLTGKAGNLLRAGKDLTLAAFGGADTFDLAAGGADLAAGGNLKVTLGGPLSAMANTAAFDAVTAGGSLTLTGGAGGDDVRFAGDVTVGGDFAFATGDGSNYLDLNALVAGTNTIGGKLTYTGGKNVDQVYVDGTTVGKSAVFDLKDGPADGQFLYVGRYMTEGVRVYGSFQVKAGVGKDDVNLARLYVANRLLVDTGAGDDTVTLNDTQVSGLTKIQLGLGADKVLMELDLVDNNGFALGAAATFAGPVTVLGGAGADTLNLSADADATTVVRFGSPVTFDGGVGDDELLMAGDTLFLGGPIPTGF